MSILSILGLFVGVPLLVFSLLSARYLSRKGPRAATYHMSERWTHPPILWAATGEAIGGHGASEFSVGGGASGNW